MRVSLCLQLHRRWLGRRRRRRRRRLKQVGTPGPLEIGETRASECARVRVRVFCNSMTMLLQQESF